MAAFIGLNSTIEKFRPQILASRSSGELSQAAYDHLSAFYRPYTADLLQLVQQHKFSGAGPAEIEREMSAAHRATSY